MTIAVDACKTKKKIEIKSTRLVIISLVSIYHRLKILLVVYKSSKGI